MENVPADSTSKDPTPLCRSEEGARTGYFALRRDGFVGWRLPGNYFAANAAAPQIFHAKPLQQATAGEPLQQSHCCGGTAGEPLQQSHCSRDTAAEPLLPMLESHCCRATASLLGSCFIAWARCSAKWTLKSCSCCSFCCFCSCSINSGCFRCLQVCASRAACSA